MFVSNGFDQVWGPLSLGCPTWQWHFWSSDSNTRCEVEGQKRAPWQLKKPFNGLGPENCWEKRKRTMRSPIRGEWFYEKANRKGMCLWPDLLTPRWGCEKGKFASLPVVEHHFGHIVYVRLASFQQLPGLFGQPFQEVVRVFPISLKKGISEFLITPILLVNC